MVVASVVLAGCSASGPGTPGPSSAGPSSATSSPSLGTPTVAPSSPKSATPTGWTTPAMDDAATDALLAKHGLTGKSVEDVIAALESSTDKRPLALTAVVKQTVLELSDGTASGAMVLPADRFYLAVAPAKAGNKACTQHNLSVDQGELRNFAVHVVINDANNSPLVDADATTNANGFVGFWLPRDRKGLITMTAGSLSGQTSYATGPGSPTCRTGLTLS